MNSTEKVIVLTTFGAFVLYVVLFNLNFPYYWDNSPRIVPEAILKGLWLILITLQIITLIICIRDSGKRKLASRLGWIAYMVLVGVIGIPHYYLKHGRHPRA